MKTKLLTATGLAAMLSISAANADWNGSVGYLHVSDDFDVGAIYASVGHRFELGEGFSFNPELRAGFGVGDDTETVDGVDVDVELDHFFGLTARFEYQTQSPLYLFVTPSYTRFKLSTAAFIEEDPSVIPLETTSGPISNGVRVSGSESTWEFGIGVGAGYMFTERFGAEVGYENIDGADVFTGAIRVRF